MITITKQNDGVLFEFEDSKKYLYGNGSILVPFNTLSIVADESDMITLKKAASNDVFISARYDTDLGYRSKDDAIDDLKDLLFAETGGGVTSGDVETMIDTALDDYYDKDEVDAGFDSVNATLSGKADTSAVTAVANDVSTLSGQVQTKVAITDFNAYSATTDARLAEDEEVTAAALNNLNENKQDALTAGQGIDITNNVISSTVNITVDPTLDTGSTNPVANSAITNAINAKVNTSAITTSITSGSTDSEIPTAKAVYYATQSGGGGATYSAGTNISIANDTIDCTLNLRNGTGLNSIAGVQGEAKGKYNFAFGQDSTAGTSRLDEYAFAFGYNCKARKGRSFAYGATNDVKEIDSAAFGQAITLNAPRSFAAGYHNVTNNWVNIALGEELTTNNRPEFATGVYNNSVTGSTASGQTLFSVGNGTGTSARHNAFEIRQNGDIYVNDGTNDVRLQDTILALGGLKLVKLTQSEYDQLATKDANTLYIISNVVS